MKLFGKRGNARDKWRRRARWIDLHQTKVTLEEAPPAATPDQAPTLDSQGWFRQILLEALRPVADDAVALPIEKAYAPEMPARNVWPLRSASCEPPAASRRVSFG
jgi:hypothetical protein